ncbi:MAG TPA: metallophosphoesterase, partial [Chitinophagaceae bacterium]|nr:metallophosphoesterase [Chitinophagaceae bacterium]
MIQRLSYFILFFLPVVLHAQQTILQRIILIGDAGEMDSAQMKVIDEAASKIIAGKTTLLYLGDNIYPTGMALPGNNDEAAKKNLQSQYAPMRAKGAAVYFVPGNHDWDRSGADGLQKIKLQWKFLNEQQDSLLKLVPENGCPDPYEINLSDNLAVIAFDSEWWLYPFNKNNPDAECDCKTKDDITAKLDELMFKNRYKIILLADHHPFQSYGRHGGYFSWKDHLFPLTAVNKNLYVPMPVMGSLYPLLRRTFSNPEDLHHPLYKDMITKINATIDSLPNVIHVSGHEHTLQLIKSNQLQIVSGSGAKEGFVTHGRNALYTTTENGFVIADLLPNNDLQLTYFTITDNSSKEAYSYTKKYIDVKELEDAAINNIQGDSITVKENAAFDEHGGLHNFFFGENYRKEYAAPTTLPVIRISEIYGGLMPTKRGGGHQSHSLRLKDKDGKEYVLRSVDKYPEVLLPEQLRETFAKDWVRDAMSAQHPYSALVVPTIANAVNVPHSNPVIGYVAPDKKLGIYSKTFANTVCLLEEREPFGKSDNTGEMMQELDADNDNSFDSTEFLRARLLDLFLGDWDRHDDQWRWADVQKGKGKRYVAVPRDRDQVFHKTEGLFPSFASRPWVAPFLHNFDDELKKVNAFFFESRYLNSRFLNQFSYNEWMKITNDFKALLTDSLMEAALQKLPAASYNIRHDELLSKWKGRRENLPDAMSRYYYFLNKIVDIKTSDKNELVEITDASNDGLTITIYKLSKEKNIKQLLYKRTFDAGVTKEVRLFIS